MPLSPSSGRAFGVAFGSVVGRRCIGVLLGLAAIATAGVLASPGSAIGAVTLASSGGGGGSAHAAVVGGAPAASGTWPWLAYITDRVGPTDVQFCGGTVVAPNLILTAAHCVEDTTTGVLDDAGSFTVVTGSLDWTDTAVRQVSAVTQLIVHPTSDATSATYGINIVGDAALLVLATPTTAPAVTLADAGDVGLIDANTPAMIAGWGLTDPSDSSGPNALQAAPTVIQDDAYCTYKNPEFDSLAQVCTLDVPEFTTSTCNGDSGGPLLSQDADGTWVEVGIASTSDVCNTTLPDFFTRVDYIDSWAQGWLAELTPAAPSTTSAPTPTPAPPPTPAASSTPAAPVAGRYLGTTGQRDGQVDTTVGEGGITRINVRFDLHCPHDTRGPLTETSVFPKPLTLKRVGKLWNFTTVYRDKQGWRIALTGTFPPGGIASDATGTLEVTTKNGRCRSGDVRWSAPTPPA